MLEKLLVSGDTYGVQSITMSDNSSSDAENQQERLIKIGWVIGFVDGEGCFSIGFVKQPDRKEASRIRRGYKTGYQVSHDFAVVQGAKSVHCLKELQKFFGVGHIYINRRYDNHKEHLYRYCVTKRDDLLNVIIPFFERHSLQSSKQADFRKFASVLRLMKDGKHLTKEGLVDIANIVTTMNHQKPRKALIGILRDYTSNIRGTG
jgi:hypothetical protein